MKFIISLFYKYWLRVRTNSKDEFNEKLCYCGHTSKCECSDPSETLFIESVKRKTIKLFDKNNGWKKLK